ncbi:MAG TPA: sugar-binding protein, partial [Blastocatellia bacterium]
MKYLFVMLALIAIAAPVCGQKISSSSTGSTSSAKTSAVAPAPEKVQPIRVPLTVKAPVIDGKLDDEVWKSAATLKDFYQTHPGDNIAPSHQTEVMIAFDNRTLYLAFRARDESGKVRATVTPRDDVFSDDTVQIMLDTFNDKRKAYVLV